MFMCFITLSAAITLVHGALIPHDGHDHTHNVNQGLPSAWFQTDDHPVHALFKRAFDDGVDYPAVGSPAWSAPFPTSTPDPNALPAEWANALNAAVAAGKIPNIPQSSGQPQTNPVYPSGTNPTSPEVCSATYKCRNAGDIWNGPDGYFGTSFDDGPQPFTPKLLQFLDQNNEKATHFMIGVNILAFPQQFMATLNSDNDIAVHTWTHPYMTTLSNRDIVGQLGWTMELIHRSTGGRVPKFWRPPFGDSDNRVRAIAQEVFGLQTIIWNLDTSDWGITTGATTPEQVHTNMQQWLSGPKSPGLIILEHETSEASVDAFIAAYPLIKSNGWKTESLAELVGNGRSYRNAGSSASNDVTSAGILIGNASPNSSSSTQSSSSSPSISTTTSSSASSASSTTQTTFIAVVSTAATSLAASSTPTSNSATVNRDCGFLTWILSTFISATVMSVALIW